MMFILERVKSAVNAHKPVTTAINVGCAIAVLFSVYTTGYVLLENTSINEGLWQSWQTFTTVGYGNAPAASKWGRIFSMIVGTIGIGVMAVLIAVLSEMRQYFKERKRLGFMKNTFVNGYVIVNWPGKLAANKIITQLREAEPNVPMCFVDSELEALPASIQSQKDIHYFRGNLTDKETYIGANVLNNKAAFIFPKDPECPDADITTKSITEIVLNFVEGKTDVLYMLCDSENQWLFPKEATPIMKNLWVLSMVQEIQDKHSSTLIEKLINNNDGESINSLKVKTSGNLAWWSARDKLITMGVNPIGIRKINKNTQLLPSNDTVIAKGDTIFLACRNDRNLEEVHDEVFN